MTEDPIGPAAREALWIALQAGGPPLAALLVTGLAVSVVQALTQVQEPTLAFLPKLAVLGATLLLFGPTMLEVLRGYALALFDRAIAVGGLP
jgi:flagellar biosynthesis protein FliQ